jgi:hypothetical protein
LFLNELLIFLTHFFELSNAILYVVQSDGARFAYDRVGMLEQVLNLASIINHFTDSNKALMLHNWSLFRVHASIEQERHSHMEDLLHLGQDEGNLMLEQR